MCQYAVFPLSDRIFDMITVLYGQKPYYTVKGKIRPEPYYFDRPYFAFLQGKRRSWVQFPVRAALFALAPQFSCIFLLENASRFHIGDM